MIKGKIASISEEMKEIRKGLRLCDGIEERSGQMEEELKVLEQETERKDEEVINSERSFGRRGGTGRADVPGRY